MLAERVRIDTDRGLESRTTAQADRLVFGDDLFRADFNVHWREQESGITYGPGARLFIPLDDRSAFSLETELQAETEPDHLVEQIDGIVRYRRKVFGDWSIVEAAPRIMFRHEDDYGPSYGFLLRIEIEF
jgi:hypothetical protein